MSNRLGGYIPCISEQSGQLIASDEYQRLGIGVAAIRLSTLLSRPGIEALAELASIKSLFAFQGEFIVNAQSFPAAKQKLTAEGMQFRSVIDGKRLSLSRDESIKWASFLGCDTLLLSPTLTPAPVEFSSMKYFVSALEFERAAKENIPHGLSYQLTDFDSLDVLLDTLTANVTDYPFMSHYVIAELDAIDIKRCLLSGAQWVESNQPLQRAIEATIYTSEGLLSLVNAEYKHSLSPLADDCDCTTCQQFTRSYFHHLQAHTPLLSQRLLAIHNLHFTLRHCS